MLYFLCPTVDKFDSMIALKENSKQVKRYFLWEREDGTFLESTKVQFEVLEGYTKDEVKNADYLIVESELFVISTKVYNALYNFIKNDVLLYPVDVCFGKDKFEFYLGKIITRRSLVDRNKSSLENLQGGDVAITNIVYSNNLEEDFYLARDIQYNNRYAASSKFINLLSAKNLKIRGVPHPIL